MNFKQKLNTVKAFVFDVDGVLTDGTVTILPDGEQVRRMSIKDGYALQLAVKAGYIVAIISGGKSEGVVKRLKGLGIQDIYMGVADKRDALDELCEIHQISKQDILYMGDDMPDYEVMNIVGIATCPADAAIDIKQLSIYISEHMGGAGCVRDVIEQTMRLQGKWIHDTETKSI